MVEEYEALTVDFTEEQYEIIRRNAMALGLTKEEYIRKNIRSMLGLCDEMPVGVCFNHIRKDVQKF